MVAAAFIQSISFLLFACSARLLLPGASLSLTRRTVRSRLARSFAAPSTGRRQRCSSHTGSHFHAAAHGRVHDVLGHRTFHRSHWLVTRSVGDCFFEEAVELRHGHVVSVLHFFDRVFKFLFELFSFHLTLPLLLVSLVNQFLFQSLSDHDLFL